MSDDIVRMTQQVLTEHQRRGINGCICGWAVLGASFPGHQAAQLLKAGVLIESDPSPSYPGGDVAAYQKYLRESPLGVVFGKVERPAPICMLDDCGCSGLAHP